MHLLDSISGARVFLILTYRPEFVHTWGGKSYHSQITLNRLSNCESFTMVIHLLNTDEIDSALEDLFQNLQGDQDKLALKFTFSKAGFEYKIHGATVEISPDSVSELLSEMVNPDLQEIIANVVYKIGKKSSNEKHTNESNWKDDFPPDRSKDRDVTAKGK